MKHSLVILMIALSCCAGVSFAAPETGSDPSTTIKTAPSDVATNTPLHRRQLTEEQKAQLAERADATWNKLTPEAKIRLMRVHQALVEMPAEERQLIHQQIERFLNMSPAEREQLRQNAKAWNEMTPEQREKARALYRQRRHELQQQNSSTNQPPAAGSLPAGQ